MTEFQKVLLYLLVITTGLSLIVISYFTPINNTINPEYKLELIDQNKVIIRSISSNKYITTTPDVLDTDKKQIRIDFINWNIERLKK